MSRMTRGVNSLDMSCVPGSELRLAACGCRRDTGLKPRATSVRRPAGTSVTASPAPGRSRPVRNVERAEHSERRHPGEEQIAFALEFLDLVGEVGLVLLVHQHLAPVLDREIARRLGEVAKEGTAKEGSAAPADGVPRAVGAEEPFECRLAPGLHVELPHESNHGFLP